MAFDDKWHKADKTTSSLDDRCSRATTLAQAAQVPLYTRRASRKCDRAAELALLESVPAIRAAYVDMAERIREQTLLPDWANNVFS